MPSDCVEMFACVCVPQADGSVLTCTCDFVSIWAKRNAKDRTRMPSDCVEMFACVCVPQADGVCPQLALAILFPSGLNATLQT